MGGFEIGDRAGFGDGVLRGAGDQIDDARAALSTDTSITDEAIHDARKHIKRARALIRLLAGVLPKAARRAENARLRDAARALSDVRDRHVVLVTATRLAEEDASTDGGLGRTASALRQRRAQASPEVENLRALCDLLARARAGVDDAGHLPRRMKTRGLRRTYARGRDALHAAEQGGGVADYHEFRKRAKDLRHQIEFLTPIWPAVLDAVAAELARLTDLLGDANDISLLMRTVENDPEQDKDDGEVLTRRLDEKRALLWRDALAVGARLYAETPVAFSERMRAWWAASRRAS
jgi:CHAD domain-containing protein